MCSFYYSTSSTRLRMRTHCVLILLLDSLCVLIRLPLCPHSILDTVSSRVLILLLDSLCVLIRLPLCPHSTTSVSSFDYVCVLTQLPSSYNLLCPSSCVLERWGSCYTSSPIYVSSFNYVCVLVLIQLDVPPCVSSYYYMCSHATRCVSS